jgi:hypothetical protein
VGRRRVHVKACGLEPARREPAQLETPAGLAALQLNWAPGAGLAAASAQGRPLLAASPHDQSRPGSPEWSLSSVAACSSGSSPVRPVAGLSQPARGSGEVYFADPAGMVLCAGASDVL